MSGSPAEREINVPERGMIEEPVRLSPEPGVRVIRVETGAASRARFILEAPTGTDLELTVGPGSCVDLFVWMGGEGEPSRHLYRLKKHASLNVWSFTGQGKADIRQEILFEEEHAFASLRGLSLLSGVSTASHQVHADHRAGHCISRQFYKSIVGGKAKSVFESLVSVARGAEKSDSKQLNKNLILSREAKAVSRPELRIHTDDVACAHGSATGEMDQAALFYLQSRGIHRDAARGMMIDSFASEVLEDLPPIPYSGRFESRVKENVRELAEAK